LKCGHTINQSDNLCLLDSSLREREYDRIEINVLTPIIPFHETIIAPPKVDFSNESLANLQQQFKSNKIIEERLSCLLGNFIY